MFEVCFRQGVFACFLKSVPEVCNLSQVSIEYLFLTEKTVSTKRNLDVTLQISKVSYIILFVTRDYLFFTFFRCKCIQISKILIKIALVFKIIEIFEISRVMTHIIRYV